MAPGGAPSSLEPSIASLPLIAIVGPTASGKSVLSIYLAEQFGGEVLACDSTQLYRGFDTGTAKPSLAERRGIPHHLIDIFEASEAATAGGYRALALQALADLRTRRKLPVFTVGTGLYLRALLEGLADLPQRSEQLRERLRASAAEHPPGHLQKILKRLDSETAGNIAPGDTQKLIRAIEVCLLAKQPVSQVHRAGRAPLEGWRAIKLGLLPGRDALYDRIHQRTDSMLVHGWLEEVRHLVQSGLPENAKPFDFIGYRQLRSVLRKQMSLDAARAAIQQATRRYAKRQLTWFRKEPHVHWLPGFGDHPQIQQEARQFIASRMAPAAP